MLILITGIIKLYMITITQDTLVFKRFAYEQIDIVNQLSYFFGLLVVGNIVDNLADMKPVLLISQCLIAIGWILTGLITQLHDEIKSEG